MLEYIVQKGKDLGYGFSVTSNGYDLDKYLYFIEQNRTLFSFQITIDGVEDIHNERKPHFKNQDSFSKITSNVDSLVKMGISVSIRINTDPYTMERVDELFMYFKEKGWFQYKNFKPYCALLRKEVPIKGEGEDFSKKCLLKVSFSDVFRERFKRRKWRSLYVSGF